MKGGLKNYDKAVTPCLTRDPLIGRLRVKPAMTKEVINETN